MGLSPKEFFHMRRKDFHFVRKGFYDRLKYEKTILRQAAILSGGIAHAKNTAEFINSVFPIEGDNYKSLTIEQIRERKAWYKMKTSKQHKEAFLENNK